MYVCLYAWSTFCEIKAGAGRAESEAKASPHPTLFLCMCLIYSVCIMMGDTTNKKLAHLNKCLPSIFFLLFLNKKWLFISTFARMNQGGHSHRVYSHNCDYGSKPCPALFSSLTVDCTDFWPLTSRVTLSRFAVSRRFTVLLSAL